VDTIAESFNLRRVGIVRSKIKDPFLTAGDSDIKMQGEIDAVRAEIRESYQMISEIIINEDLTDILDGIEGYSHLVVLYWAHKVPEKSRLLTRVHPIGSKDTPIKGIFSTCSPARPNPVLMSAVKLCKREKNVLRVSGLDAVDGSSVIDIKPYVKGFYPQEEVYIPEWMQKLCQEMNQ